MIRKDRGKGKVVVNQTSTGNRVLASIYYIKLNVSVCVCLCVCSLCAHVSCSISVKLAVIAGGTWDQVLLLDIVFQRGLR